MRDTPTDDPQPLTVEALQRIVVEDSLEFAWIKGRLTPLEGD